MTNLECPLCGFSGNPSGSQFCAMCGGALAPVTPPNPPAPEASRPWLPPSGPRPTPTAQEQRASMPIVQWIMLAVGAGSLVAFLGGLAFGATILVSQLWSSAREIQQQPTPASTPVAAATRGLPPAAALPAATPPAWTPGTATRTSTPQPAPQVTATRTASLGAASPSPSRTKAPGAPESATLLPLLDNAYTGVKVYLKASRSYFGEILGRASDCPRADFPNGKGIKWRDFEGSDEWVPESRIRDLGIFMVNAADPAVQAKQTTILTGCK